MDKHEIDALLQRYQDAEQRIASNLIELDDHPTYRILTAGSSTGATGAEMTRLTDATTDLWAWLSSLRDVLLEARRLHEDQGWFRDKTDQLEFLLTGASIVLALQHSPIESRDILAKPERAERVTIEQLLAKMRDAYEPLRDGVARIDAVWRDLLPRLDAAETSVRAASAQATRLGIESPELAQARQRLDAIRSTFADDPLSLAPSVGDSLDNAVADAVAAIEALATRHDQLRSELQTATRLVSELRVLRAQAAAAYSESSAKFVEPNDLVRVPAPEIIDGQHGLSHRLTILREAPATSWQQTSQALTTWLDGARRLRDQLTRALQRNRSPLEQRDELRGRLLAYRAKAGGAPTNTRVADLADDIHNELYTRLTNLDRARTLLGDLAAALRE